MIRKDYSKTMHELVACAREQGFTWDQDSHMWIPLGVFYRLKEIENDEKIKR